ncbi:MULTISPECIES: aminotransferase class V-fold PLP-dependent enzyme [unclassified Spirosoma]|uniref:aminotransferase class V-fold PLP-dependent enzyme n=1 Tax=unclassified Spirosoma TaxID=2621999 RepID=UPI000961707A|nr:MULTISPECIES: aminotransferase class V-fold PLP-dependent enzyme [unclassified Spirosoma]MBN8821390.1 alanine--glyoxylate aminotransferase family protein [Spirosoma sp.]OJW78175.1 MAG: phosphoserine aminotransferase [Spirosoma sp. 48-14]
MITFYPGPSKVYPQVADYAVEAVRQGIVSLNHRSAGFMDVVKETIHLLHEKLAIPADYHIALVSSATECWEIVAQSLTGEASLHPHSGAFGKKWAEYAYRIKPPTSLSEADVLCIVQNETSNGTQVSMETLAQFRRDFTGLIAVDAVSSMAGIVLDWTLADVWFASVQKCFGLPAGLAVLIYSPNALKRAEEIGENSHYNSLLFIHENFSKFQTPYTPNGLGIYLLMRVLQQLAPIADVASVIKHRAAAWYSFFENELAQSSFQLLNQDTLVRSDTVIAVQGSDIDIKAIKTAAQQAGIMLGNGYGDWKTSTFRIANFPAISTDEIETLKQFLLNYCLADILSAS